MSERPNGASTAAGGAGGIVDPHHHLWDLSHHRYPWLQDPPFHDRGWGDWTSLRRDYLVTDYLRDARNQPLVKSVHVQANYDPADPVGETRWLQGVADEHGFPHAFVVYADLSAPDAAEVLDAHGRYPNVRGVRQVLNRHADPRLNRAPRDYLASPDWRRGLRLLAPRGLSFDAQLYPGQMAQLARIVEESPGLEVVIDHAGMPVTQDEAGLREWRDGMRALARLPSVMVKLSGFGMLDRNWSAASIRPIVASVVEWFGADRCMFGSNFPVDRLMRDYDSLWEAYYECASDCTVDERRALFSTTARRAYGL